jgi:hypothetical protein
MCADQIGIWVARPFALNVVTAIGTGCIGVPLGVLLWPTVTNLLQREEQRHRFEERRKQANMRYKLAALAALGIFFTDNARLQDEREREFMQAAVTMMRARNLATSLTDPNMTMSVEFRAEVLRELQLQIAFVLSTVRKVDNVGTRASFWTAALDTWQFVVRLNEGVDEHELPPLTVGFIRHTGTLLRAMRDNADAPWATLTPPAEQGDDDESYVEQVFLLAQYTDGAAAIIQGLREAELQP